MRQKLFLGGLVLVVALGCQDRRKAIERVGEDEAILKKVNGAVNEVIRNAADCEVAKPLLKEAYGRIDEARPQLKLAASQQTLEALKVQVDRIAQVCP
jgi:GTP1/Obg family GTP-binding protein